MTARHTPEQPPAGNRAARRAARRKAGAAPPPEHGPDPAHGTGKVGPVRFGHGTDPRQFAAHRRG